MIMNEFFLSFSQWKRILSATNQQQLDCLLKHMQHSQSLNLWSKQTEKSSNGNAIFNKKQKRIQIITPNSSPPTIHREISSTATNTSTESTETPSSIIKAQPASSSKSNNVCSKLDWVVLPTFVDIVKIALKTREECSVR
jgi:hypothetical protein